MPLVHSALIIALAQANLDLNPPIFKLLTIAEKTGMPHHAQIFPTQMESHKLFLQTGLEW
jgi:hypothetical protein